MRVRSAAASAVALLAVGTSAWADAGIAPRVLTGGSAVERSATGLPWVAVAQGHAMHASWQVMCSDGCTLGLFSGATVRLDQGAIVRDSGGVFAHTDAKSTAVLSDGIEVLHGGATAELSNATHRPVVLTSTDATQIVVRPGGAGRLAMHEDHTAVGAVDAEAQIRWRSEPWIRLGAGFVAVEHGGKFGAPHPLPRSPKWTSVGLGAGPIGLADEKGIAKIGVAWHLDPRALSYRLEIARDASFAKPLEMLETSSDSFAGELPIGDYLARVRSIDADGFESAPTPPRDIKVVEVKLPQGSLNARADRTLVVPDSIAVRIGEPGAFEVGLDRLFFKPQNHADVLLEDQPTRRLWVRFPGDFTSATSFMIERSALHADVDMTPHLARWPADPIEITVRITDSSHRIAPESITPVLHAMLDLDEVPVTWQHDGSTWKAHLAPRLIGSNTVVRVTVSDEHQNPIGRGFIEIAPSPRTVRPIDARAIAAR